MSAKEREKREVERSRGRGSGAAARAGYCGWWPAGPRLAVGPVGVPGA